MSTRKKAQLPPTVSDVREQTDRIRDASQESSEQIAESRRLLKDSRRRTAARQQDDQPIKGNRIPLRDPSVKE
jgi:hypothetical protein